MKLDVQILLKESDRNRENFIPGGGVVKQRFAAFNQLIRPIKLDQFSPLEATWNKFSVLM